MQYSLTSLMKLNGEKRAKGYGLLQPSQEQTNPHRQVWVKAIHSME
jgi:hypothetical protein